MVGTRTPGTPPGGRSAVAAVPGGAAGAGVAPQAVASTAAVAHTRAASDRSGRRAGEAARTSLRLRSVVAIATTSLGGTVVVTSAAAAGTAFGFRYCRSGRRSPEGRWG